MSNGFNSFEQWCIENSKHDILDRWDYELNDCKPSDITYGTTKKYWFRCPKGIHESELKLINNYTSGHKGSIDCKVCNSFGQFLMDMYGKNSIDNYWSNRNFNINPFTIDKFSTKYIYIKCQNKHYHESYKISCASFTQGKRCPYCSTRHGKVHPLDSLGNLLEVKDLLHSWSNKNKKSPYEYTPSSNQKVWWKCLENTHKDYFRDICHSNRFEFRCPECNFSKGEKRIDNYLLTHRIDYIPQKEFEKLIGLGNGSLSYDFYLSQPYNLLIEYQGEQHEKYIKGFHKSKKDFEKQQEHDCRKREYAQKNGIKLLEIWHWDFDRIEEILKKELNIKEGNK
jgi:hypothetical protein